MLVLYSVLDACIPFLGINMDICRVCLSSKTNRDISQLRTTKKQGCKSPSEIMKFCLAIEVDENSKITKKLCSKCFNKIRSFYNFKALALRSDATLKSLASESPIKHDEPEYIEELIRDEPEYIEELIRDEPEYIEELIRDEPEYIEELIRDEPEYIEETENVEETENGEEECLYDVKLESDQLFESEDAVKIESQAFDAFDSEDESTHKTIKSEDARYDRDSENGTEGTALVTAEDDKNVMCNVLLSEETSVKKTAVSRKKKEKISRKSKKVHSKQADGEMCEECGKTVKNLKEHAMVHLPKQMRRKYPCKDPDCSKSFNTPNARYVHNKIKHLGIKKHCHICNKDFVDLGNHVKKMHEPSRMPYACVLCARRFVSQSALAEHVSIHTSDRKHACERCGKTFRLATTLKIHIRGVHMKETPFTCQYCSKSFFRKERLKIHLRYHTKDKPYQCNICEKRFLDSKYLKKHVLTHSTTKDVQCTQCPKSFKSAEYLRTHMISHTKIKKHQCKYCGVSFGRSDHRKRHEFTAHEKYMLDETNDEKVDDKTNIAADGQNTADD